MSAELDYSNGRANIAYLGSEGKPWHHEGQAMPDGAPIEAWRDAAGMGFKIQRSIVRYATRRGFDGVITEDMIGKSIAELTGLQAWEDKHVLFRQDTGKPMGNVSASYKIVQPAAVAEFFRDTVEREGATISTMGVLFGGERFWALAKTNESTFIRDRRDRIARYMLLSTSANGESATEIKQTDICVVCWNTLSAAKRDGKPTLRVTHKSIFDAAAAKEKLGLTEDKAKEEFAEAIEGFRRLAGTRVTGEQVVVATGELLKPGFLKMKPADQEKLMRRSNFNRIGELTFGKQQGGELDGRNGTAWSWLNATTQYVDHETQARGDNKADNRLESAWFGQGDQVKQRARQIAMMLADGPVEYRDAAPADYMPPVDLPAGPSDDFAALLGKPAKV